MLAPVSMHAVLNSPANGVTPEQDGAMLAPVSMHAVLNSAGGPVCPTYHMLFCQGASPSSTKGFSTGRILFPKERTLVLTVRVPVRPI